MIFLCLFFNARVNLLNSIKNLMFVSSLESRVHSPNSREARCWWRVEIAKRAAGPGPVKLARFEPGHG
jgi:hypothetical protein